MYRLLKGMLEANPPWKTLLLKLMAQRFKLTLQAVKAYAAVRNHVACRQTARREAKRARRLQYIESLADDASFEGYVEGLAALPQDALECIVRHLGPSSACALARTCREFAHRAKGAALQAIMPRFVLRRLPPATPGAGAAPGCFPHLQVQGTDAQGQAALVDTILSERRVHVFVDFGYRQQRPVALRDGLLVTADDDGGDVAPARAVPDPDDPTRGTLPEDHVLRRAPYPDADARERREDFLRAHWLAAEGPQGELNHTHAFHRLPTSRYFVVPPTVEAFLVDAQTHAEVHENTAEDYSRAPREGSRRDPSGGDWSRTTAVLPGRCFWRLELKKEGALRNERLRDRDHVQSLPSVASCYVRSTTTCGRHANRRFRLAVRVQARFLAAFGGERYDRTFFSDPFQSIGNKRWCHLRRLANAM
jgi:hypothetical protein